MTQYSVEDAPTKTKYSIEDAPAPPTATPEPGIRDQIISVFNPLSAGERKGIESTFGKYPGAAVEGLSNAVLGVASAGANMLLHPLSTVYGSAQMAADALNQMFPDSGLNPQQKAAKQASLDRLKTQWEQIKDNPDYAIGNIVGGIEAGKVIGGSVGPITRGLMEKADKAREGTRTAAQSLMGAGGRVVKGEVAKAGEAAKTADESHLNQTREALHETEGKELKHQQDVKAAKETAEQESKKQTAKQIADRNKAIQDRRAAEEKLTAEKLKQGKIKPTQAKLENAWSSLRAGIETARENALRIGNEKYSALNEKLNPVESDMEQMTKALDDSMQKIKGSDTEPPILKDFAKKVQQGELLTYKDLQGYYSELNRELSKGTLQGDVYAAYDTLHDAIGDDMQRIADSQGQGAEFKGARDYWRLMKQTFGKPFNATDAATKTLDSAAPDLASSAEQANRVRLLGAFDPEIPKLFSHIENIQKGVDALPKPVPERTLTEKAKLPSVPARGKPVTVEPKPVAPPERVPLPDRPETSTVDTRALREKLVDKWATGESSLNKWQVRALLSGGLSALIDGVGLLGGHAPGIGSMVLEAGGTAAYTFGPAMVAKLLEKPAFREWITRPPADELETLKKLPNADRIQITDGLKQAVQQAQRQGIQVDPKLAALVGAGAAIGPKTQQLQKTADDARNAAQ